MVHGIDMLYLHDNGNLVVGVLKVIYPAVKPCPRSAVAPCAERRVARGLHCLHRLLATVNHGDDQSVGAGVQSALDRHRVVPGHSDHGHSAGI